MAPNGLSFSLLFFCCLSSQFLPDMCAVHAAFQPNRAAPLSSVAVAAEGQLITKEGPKPKATPKALDKAGIAQVSSM